MRSLESILGRPVLFVVLPHRAEGACALRELGELMELQRQEVRFSGLACDQITLSSSAIDPPAGRDSCWDACHAVMEVVLGSSHYKTCNFLTFLSYSRTLCSRAFSHHQNQSPEQFQVIIILDLKTAIQTDSRRYVCQLPIACRVF